MRATQGRSIAGLVSSSTEDVIDTKRAALKVASYAPSPYDHQQSTESRRLVLLHTPSSMQPSEELMHGASQTHSRLGTINRGGQNDETFESIGYEPIQKHIAAAPAYAPIGNSDTVARKNRLLP